MTRNEMIVDCRKHGMKFREIGEKFGITASRAMEICEKESRKEEWRNRTFLAGFEDRYGGLAVHIVRGIHRSFFPSDDCTDEDVIGLIKSGEILRGRQIGEKSICVLCDFYGLPLPEYITEKGKGATNE